MLTFFRKLRKSLITSNQSRKYLLYAIGEIALVVIGILIALQINNWNEARKQKGITNTFRQNLIEELNIDLNELEQVKDDYRKNINMIENYVKYYNLPAPDITVLVRKMDSIDYGTPKFTSKCHTMDEIIFAGHLSWLKSEEKNALLALRSAHIEMDKYYSDNIQDLLNYANALNEQIDVMHFYGFSPKEHSSSSQWKYNPQSEPFRLFNNEMAAALFFSKIQEDVLGSIEEKSIEFLDILQRNLSGYESD